MPKLEYVLGGIKLDQAKNGQKSARRVRLPMTPSILRQMRAVLERERSKYDNIMLWAACCTCFFGFLCSGEIVVPTTSSYDPAVHLSFGDVMVDRPDAPIMAQIIKASKTDPFRKSISSYVGRTGNDLCPVAASTAYLAGREEDRGQSLGWKMGGLLRKLFVSQVKTTLTRAGVDATKYLGHSFQIGAASTAAARGIEDYTIRTLGKWESAAYLLYVRVP